MFECGGPLLCTRIAPTPTPTLGPKIFIMPSLITQPLRAHPPSHAGAAIAAACVHRHTYKRSTSGMFSHMWHILFRMHDAALCARDRKTATAACHVSSLPAKAATRARLCLHRRRRRRIMGRGVGRAEEGVCACRVYSRADVASEMRADATDPSFTCRRRDDRLVREWSGWEGVREGLGGTVY